MSNKLRTHPRYFIFLITISLLFALPAFADPPKAKTRTKKITEAKNQNSEVKITKFDASIAYDIWTQYYQAKEKSINPPLPVFKPNADTETTKQLMAMWNQGQQRAYKNFVRKMEQKAKAAQQISEQLNLDQELQAHNLSKFDVDAPYKILTQYFQAIERGERPSIPKYRVIDANAEEFNAFRLKWIEAYRDAYEDYIRKLPVTPPNQQPKTTQASLHQPQPLTKTQPSKPETKDLKVFNTDVAYKIWTEHYQAQEKGENPPLPNFRPLNAPQKEADKLIAIWNQGKDRAYKKYLRRADQKDNYDRMKSILKNVGLESTITLPTNFTSPTYDANGSMTSADGRTYSYDFEHRLIGITGNNLNVSLVYNGLGDLVSKTVNGVTTDYLVDRNNITGLPQVVEEIQNGQVVKQYSYGANGIISQRQLINGERVTSFYGKDGHGSIRYLTDSNGNITDTYDYDAYGNLINQTGNTPNNYLFAGERFDSDLGLYYLRARFLNTVTGRFLTQDSFEGSNEEPLSLHKYLYANANPINNIDPSGNTTIVTAAIGFAESLTLNTRSRFSLTQGNASKDKDPIETDDFPDITGIDLLITQEALSVARGTALLSQECDQAIKDKGENSLYDLVSLIQLNVNAFDGRTSSFQRDISRGRTQSYAKFFNRFVGTAAEVVPNTKEKGTIIFFNKYVFKYPKYQGRARTLLHESIHMFGKMLLDSDFDDPKTDKNGSMDLDEKLRKKCFPEVKMFPPFDPNK